MFLTASKQPGADIGSLFIQRWVLDENGILAEFISAESGVTQGDLSLSATKNLIVTLAPTAVVL